MGSKRTYSNQKIRGQWEPKGPKKGSKPRSIPTTCFYGSAPPGVAERNDNKVLKACYLENVNLVNEGKRCRLGQIKSLLVDTLGL